MVAATYALMVTFSRGGYVSFGLLWPSCCWPRSLTADDLFEAR
jgi:hypothetical protein